VSKLWKEFRWGSYHYRDPYNYRELFVANWTERGDGEEMEPKEGESYRKKARNGRRND